MPNLCSHCSKDFASRRALAGHLNVIKRWGSKLISAAPMPMVQPIALPPPQSAPAIIYPEAPVQSAAEKMVSMQTQPTTPVDQAAGLIGSLLPIIIGKLMEPKGTSPFEEMGKRMFDRMTDNFGKAYGTAAGRKMGGREPKLDKEEEPDIEQAGNQIAFEVMSKRMKEDQKKRKRTEESVKKLSEMINLEGKANAEAEKVDLDGEHANIEVEK